MCVYTYTTHCLWRAKRRIVGSCKQQLYECGRGRWWSRRAWNALLLWELLKSQLAAEQQLTGRMFSSVQLLSHAQFFVTPWTTACQDSLSITNSWNLLKLMSIKSLMPPNHLILCRPLLLPSIFPSIRVFSNESVLSIKWPKYWSFSFNISPSNEYSGLISFRMD